MFIARKIPVRERVFFQSLQRHGFKLVMRRHNLKPRQGYVIHATDREDADGIDGWVKLPRDMRLYPIQITQRGNRLHQKYRRPDGAGYDRFQAQNEQRLRNKQIRCRALGIAFVLVRDYDGCITNSRLAWGDVKALRHAIAYVHVRYFARY